MSSDSSVEMKTVDFGEAKISYRHIGRGKRKIIFFHGFPASSRNIGVFEPYLKSHDLEVISFDRPGYGLTTSINPNQVEANISIANHFLDELGWKEYEVFSVSGGTPFLFPFVRQAKIKPKKIVAISGLGLVSEKEFNDQLSWVNRKMIKKLPGFPKGLLNFIIRQAANTEMTSKGRILNYFLPKAEIDQKMLQIPEVAESLTGGLKDALTQNCLGVVRDAQSYLLKSGFEMGAFKGPAHFWHGNADLMVSPKMSELMADKVPNSKLKLIDGEGHFSLIINHMADILGR